MGACRRVRVRRTLAAIGAAGAVTAGVVACEPGGAEGLSSFAVALTTDQRGTGALERAGVDVAWMTCTSTVGERRGTTTRPGRPATAPDARPSLITSAPDARPSVVTSGPAVRDVASVACTGQTTGGQEIRIDGRVTDERDGRCVRGDLTAKVAGRTVFRVNVLGDCDAGPSRPTSRPTTGPTHRPTWKPSRPTGNPEPTPPVGRTTVTVTPPAPDPTPDPRPDPAPDPRPTVTVTVTAPPDRAPAPAPDPAPDPRPTCGCPSDK